MVTPRYIEGYPLLRIARAVRGVTTGYDLVLWRNEAGDPIGSASTSLPASDRLRVAVCLFAMPTMPADEQGFDVPLVLLRAGEYRHEHYGRCACERTVKVLVYKQRAWRCSR